jgi:hypothetical protein
MGREVRIAHARKRDEHDKSTGTAGGFTVRFL